MTTLLKYGFGFNGVNSVTRLSFASCHWSANYGRTNFPAVDKVTIPAEVQATRNKYSKFFRLVEAFRQYGHLEAKVNPLQSIKPIVSVEELNPTQYDLGELEQCSSDVMSVYNRSSEARPPAQINVGQLCDRLRVAYCGPITAEFSHLVNSSEREWFAQAFEGGELQESFKPEEKIRICKLMLESQSYDHFLGNKFQTLKRYGAEGTESIIAFYDELFKCLANNGVPNAVVGMAHRSRLNLLTGLLRVPLQNVFRKIKGLPEFNNEFRFTGDVLFHFTSNVALQYGQNSIKVEVLPNPSHLEAVNPVAAGRTRALQRGSATGPYLRKGSFKQPPVCLMVHGDAAVAGQGVVQETLSLSSTPHFNVGGSLHVVVNNQIGFTTPPDTNRSSLFASDVALMLRAPIIRVNGDCPESMVRAARLAASYQQTFRKDVFVDMLCWRRHGHNELDNPRFTNPNMYAVIDAMKSVPDCYAEQLVSEGLMTSEGVTDITSQRMALLARSLAEADSYTPSSLSVLEQWNGLQQACSSTVEVWDTGVDSQTLVNVAAKSVEIPSDFNVHPHLSKVHIAGRLKKIAQNNAIDWATAETMAFGSLLLQGMGVRISGQDVTRGTFSQRHGGLVDQVTEQRYVPLNHLTQEQTAFIELCNSILSEEAVLGFEYGMSMNNKDTLHLWECQFGDFFNGAQIMIDTFVSSAETKWLTQSGIVLLLPHGFDGAGAEHSCCRVDRFLAACDSDDSLADSSGVNWAIASPSTPAQYFHLLRKQMVRPYRKPLVVVGPKTLLRLPAATSSLQDMAPGTHFLPVIDDPEVLDASEVRRVVFTNGKHYYSLAEERKAKGISDTAIIRLESLCPFPAHHINAVVKRYNRAQKYVWSQEEHKNMGPWSFMFPRFLNICGVKLQYAGRTPNSSTAVGISELHHAEVSSIIDQTFAQ